MFEKEKALEGVPFCFELGRRTSNGAGARGEGLSR